MHPTAVNEIWAGNKRIVQGHADDKIIASPSVEVTCGKGRSEAVAVVDKISDLLIRSKDVGVLLKDLRPICGQPAGATVENLHNACIRSVQERREPENESKV